MKKRTIPALLSVFIMVIILSGNHSTYAQIRHKPCIVYLSSKTKLMGYVSQIDDSTIEYSATSQKPIEIKYRLIDSIVVAKGDSNEYRSRGRVRMMFSAKFNSGQEYGMNKDPISIRAFDFGPGIIIDNTVCLSLLPSIENIETKGNNFLIYPDIKFLLGDNDKSVCGFLEINYFNNAFFGIKTPGMVSNVDLGIMFGNKDFKFAAFGGLKFVNDRQLFNLGVGVNIF